ncbi:hypothetical protein Ae201684P_015666 [Aphanomyces euteiches]|nr:hypothetical protein Ae201684P_015666 [Aphanomyces euteiches]
MADTMADSSAQNAGVFGDVLNSIVSSLPPDAAPSFFRCLAGLTATESNMLASYMCELKDEKKFRVIQALMDAPVPAKQKFLNGVKEKFDSVKQHTEARPRATLRQSSLQNVTSEDIRSMGNRLDNTHIGESELRLRRLEEAKTDDNSDYVKPELKSDLMINVNDQTATGNCSKAKLRQLRKPEMIRPRKTMKTTTKWTPRILHRVPPPLN